MLYALYIGLFLPLAGFLILTATSDWISRRAANLVACTALLGSFACFVSLLLAYATGQMEPFSHKLFDWIHVGRIQTDFVFTIDPLAMLMTWIITGIGFLIHVYSIGYMDHEEDYARFFACLNFFVFAMLILVLAGNLLVLFVGWEGVGLASYLLIGFWYKKPSAAQAATKAFVINRIGDLGLLLGLLLTFQLFGTDNVETISQKVGQLFAVGAPVLTALTLLYFVGATGKSAQLPLYSWLPDAMEGPTPVSALIHAATMVTAGVYLVVRMHTVFSLAPETLLIIGIIGAATALFAALCGLGQTDLKRVLAYSTVSQLGFMFIACGAAAYYSAMFHLTTHAFIKALLFLSAGNVVHMLHDTTEMGKMGGLFRVFTKTRWLFLIGVLALSGIPPLAAFLSKDLILEQEHLAGFHILYYIGLAASILTGVYLTRAYCLTFLGKPNMEQSKLAHVHEAPAVMWGPVSILAALSIGGGFLGFWCGHTSLLEGLLAPVGLSPAEKESLAGCFLSTETLLTVVGAFIGIGATALVYTRYPERLGQTIPLLKKTFYVDEIYNFVFVKPLKALANTIAYFTEPKIIDGSVHAATWATRETAYALQQVQSGEIRTYVAWMITGSILLIAYLVM